MQSLKVILVINMSSQNFKLDLQSRLLPLFSSGLLPAGIKNKVNFSSFSTLVSFHTQHKLSQCCSRREQCCKREQGRSYLTVGEDQHCLTKGSI